MAFQSTLGITVISTLHRVESERQTMSVESQWNSEENWRPFLSYFVKSNIPGGPTMCKELCKPLGGTERNY